MSLYLYLDESGDFSFGATGSKYCLFGVLSTFDPTNLNEALTGLRYQLLADGIALQRFHAAEDQQPVRDRVFAALQTVAGFEFDVVVIEKRKAPPDVRSPTELYPRFGAQLLDHVFQRYREVEHDVILITDTIPIAKHRRAIEKTFKQYVRRRLEGRRFAIYHHSSVAHPALQAADYCTWAVYRKYQRGDVRSYDLIRGFVRTELEVFAGESTQRTDA